MVISNAHQLRMPLCTQLENLPLLGTSWFDEHLQHAYKCVFSLDETKNTLPHVISLFVKAISALSALQRILHSCATCSHIPLNNLMTSAVHM